MIGLVPVINFFHSSHLLYTTQQLLITQFNKFTEILIFRERETNVTTLCYISHRKYFFYQLLHYLKWFVNKNNKYFRQKHIINHLLYIILVDFNLSLKLLQPTLTTYTLSLNYLIIRNTNIILQSYLFQVCFIVILSAFCS